jgi:NAD(P)-dependent dehydrogenase (short-subunit alcohol dehydrogenase family)
MTRSRAPVSAGSSGIGLETARVFAARGASVVLACRDRGNATASVAALPGGNVTMVDLDLRSLASIHRAAEELRSRQLGWTC